MTSLPRPTPPPLESLSPRPTRANTMFSYIPSGMTSRIRRSFARSPLRDLDLALRPRMRYHSALAASNDLLTAPDITRSERPWRKLFYDTGVLLRIFPYLPYTLLPLRPKQWTKRQRVDWKGDYIAWRTTRDDWIVGTVTVCQIFALPLVPIAWAIMPGLVFALTSFLVLGLNYGLLRAVQGERTINSQGGVLGKPTERWFFINGIMTGYNGLQSSIDHLEAVFQRPVTGIHNRTSGFVGDIVECLIQRCFSYPTEDVRITYDHLRASLIDTEVKKVVFIAHSQGGIVASLCIDRFLTDLPRDCLAKLEIYTFGSAASHFSNPLSDLSDLQPNKAKEAQLVDTTEPCSPATGVPTWSQEFYHIISNKASLQRPAIPSPALPHPSLHQTYSSPEVEYLPSKRLNHLRMPSPSLTRQSFGGAISSSLAIPPRIAEILTSAGDTPSASESLKTSAPRRTFRHIEHYANELDPIPRWGVLHSIETLRSPRYAGSAFVRLGGSGHLFSKHYLALLFPIRHEESSDADTLAQRRGQSISHLQGDVSTKGKGKQKATPTTGDRRGYVNGLEGVEWGDGQTPGCEEWEEFEDGREEDGLGRVEFVLEGDGKTVKELSRLAKYVGGGSPDDEE